MFAISFVVLKKMVLALSLMVLFLVGSMLMLIPSIGMYVGEKVYATDIFHIKHGNFVYKGVLQYESVNFYYLLDEDANRTIKFLKGEVIETY